MLRPSGRQDNPVVSKLGGVVGLVSRPVFVAHFSFTKHVRPHVRSESRGLKPNRRVRVPHTHASPRCALQSFSTKGGLPVRSVLRLFVVFSSAAEKYGALSLVSRVVQQGVRSRRDDHTRNMLLTQPVRFLTSHGTTRSVGGG